ncbi:uncharacterized protein LOC107046680 [Diachasma alloeum]|uniref:uncharacterized protein LOC107046680 n=1 Tax=Diachasma alloeum TaxID=454923 RepID=UPI0007382374|nr:uncharacterized protein LOC107046680 [Diachasma alloeum]
MANGDHVQNVCPEILIEDRPLQNIVPEGAIENPLTQNPGPGNPHPDAPIDGNQQDALRQTQNVPEKLHWRERHRMRSIEYWRKKNQNRGNRRIPPNAGNVINKNISAQTPPAGNPRPQKRRHANNPPQHHDNSSTGNADHLQTILSENPMEDHPLQNVGSEAAIENPLPPNPAPGNIHTHHDNSPMANGDHVQNVCPEILIEDRPLQNIVPEGAIENPLTQNPGPGNPHPDAPIDGNQQDALRQTQNVPEKLHWRERHRMRSIEYWRKKNQNRGNRRIPPNAGNRNSTGENDIVCDRSSIGERKIKIVAIVVFSPMLGMLEMKTSLHRLHQLEIPVPKRGAMPTILPLQCLSLEDAQLRIIPLRIAYLEMFVASQFPNPEDPPVTPPAGNLRPQKRRHANNPPQHHDNSSTGNADHLQTILSENPMEDHPLQNVGSEAAIENPLLPNPAPGNIHTHHDNSPMANGDHVQNVCPEILIEDRPLQNIVPEGAIENPLTQNPGPGNPHPDAPIDGNQQDALRQTQNVPEKLHWRERHRMRSIEYWRKKNQNRGNRRIPPNARNFINKNFSAQTLPAGNPRPQKRRHANNPPQHHDNSSTGNADHLQTILSENPMEDHPLQNVGSEAAIENPLPPNPAPGNIHTHHDNSPMANGDHVQNVCPEILIEDRPLQNIVPEGAIENPLTHNPGPGNPHPDAPIDGNQQDA